MKDNTIVKTACPSRETLQQLIDGTISDVKKLESHLRSCAPCQKQLDDLSSSNVLTPFQAEGTYYEDGSQHRFLGESKRDGDLGSINNLFIEYEIGRGGAGIVFRGFDPDLSRPVAVKVLNNDGAFRSEARFERESKIAAKIRSDYVVSVHAIGRTHDGRPYLVMPLILGTTLKELNAAQVPDERQSAEIVQQIGTGLQSLHDAGIVHRDIKPANILIDQEDRRAKLTDFGLARETARNITLTQADVLCGTPEYMSPEQSSGTQATSQSDVYALGITLYECLTGTTPFRGSPFNVLQQHCNVQPTAPRQINPELSKNLENICLKAIAKEPQRRYRSSGEFSDDLNRFLNGQPVLAKQTSWRERLYLWSKRNRGVAVLSGSVAALLLTLGIGSSVAAWNLNQANTKILAEKQKATQAQQRAVQDRTAAVSALTNLVDSLYDDLSENAATIEAREKLVDAAMSGLQSVSPVESDIVADRTALLGSRRIADLAVLKGDIATATKNYERAIELARTLIAAEPEINSLKLELASAISSLGVLNRDNDFQLSEKLNAESESILTEILDRNPDDNEALTKLVLEKGNRLELIRRNNITDFQATIDYAKTILPDLDRLLEHAENDPSVYRAGYMIYFLLGRACLESGDGKTASLHFESARKHVAASLVQSPNNFTMRSASATLDRAASMTAGLLVQMDKSLDMYLSAIATFKQLSAANPDDSMLRKQVASTLSLGSQTLLYNGKFDECTQALQDAEQIYEELIESAPTNEGNKTLFIENRLRSIFVDLSLGNWQRAFEKSNDTLEFLNGLVAQNTKNGNLINYKIKLAQDLQTTGWLVGQPLESATPISKYGALFYAFRPSLINATSLDLPPEFLETVQRIDAKFDGETFLDALRFAQESSKNIPVFQSQWARIELAIYGMIARNCAESAMHIADESASNELQNRSELYLQRCIELLEENPLDPMSVMAIPDFQWLRDTEEFQAILPELQAVWNNVNSN